MKIITLFFVSLTLAQYASGLGFHLKKPVEADIELQEDGEILLVKITFEPVKLFIGAKNEEVEQIHSKHLLARSFIKYKKAPDSSTVSYSGGRFIKREIDDFGNVCFFYEVPKSGIEVTENAVANEPKKLRTMNDVLKSMNLHGYTLRIRSDIIASMYSYIAEIKDVLDKSTSKDEFKKNILAISKDIKSNIDKTRFEKKFSNDIKISSEELKDLLELVESIQHNLKIVEQIINLRFEQKQLREIEDSSSKISEIDEEVKFLKSKLKTIKE